MCKIRGKVTHCQCFSWIDLYIYNIRTITGRTRQKYGNSGSVVSIATAYGWTVRASIVFRGSGLSLLQNCPDRLWGPPSLVFSEYPGVKWLLPGVHRSPPSIVEVTYELICTTTPRICLHGVDRDNSISLCARSGTASGYFLTCWDSWQLGVIFLLINRLKENFELETLNNGSLNVWLFLIEPETCRVLDEVLPRLCSYQLRHEYHVTSPQPVTL